MISPATWRARLAGTLLVQGCGEVIEQGRAAAGALLEVASGDIVYAEGVYRVNGTDRSLGLFEVARALQAGKPGAGSRQSLAATCDFKGRTPAYPAGCAVCELEIDAQTGQVLSGSFLDYGISRADDLPSLRVEHAEHPTAGNPLRIKGGGEGGIVPATAAVLNALCDALVRARVNDLPMPATAAAVWQKTRGIDTP